MSVAALYEAIEKAGVVAGFHGSRERKLSIRNFRRGTHFAAQKPLANYYAAGRGGKRYNVKIDTKGFASVRVPRGGDGLKYLDRARRTRAPGVRIAGLADGKGLRDRSEQFIVNDPSRVKRQSVTRLRKAGLIKPGKPHLLKRVAFLLSAGSSERNYRVGRYLKRRKVGGAIPGSRRKRAGSYTGVYKRRTDLENEAMTDVIDELYDTIEKARGLIPRGGSSRLARRVAQQGAKARDKGGDAKAAKRFSALSTLDNRKRGKAFGVGYTPAKGFASVTRRGKYR